MTAEPAVDVEDLRTRDANPADVPALVEIKACAALHHDRIRDAAASYMRYLVLEQGARIVGFACLVFRRPPHWSDADDTSHLPRVVDLQVLSSMRGRGCGSWFLREIERVAAEGGSGELYLSVDPVDNPRAHAFYLGCGYLPLQDGPCRLRWEFADSDGTKHEGEGWNLDLVKPLPLAAEPACGDACREG